MVIRWRLFLEENESQIEYINVPKNIVADSLIRLPNQNDIIDDIDVVLSFVSLDDHIFIVQLREIQV